MNHWIEIDEAALAANFHAIERIAAPATVLAVIKADGYGHGAELCAVTLARAGAHWLGVTCAEEGARVRQALRQAGFDPETPDILVMSGSLPEDTPLLREHALVPVVWTPEHLRCLAGSGVTRVQVEVDTGMGRQGVTPGQPLDDLLRELTQASLSLDGLFTHFCSSEVAGSALTCTQQQRFAGAVEQARGLGPTPAWLHAGNTSAIDNPLDPAWLPNLAARAGARPVVRSGLALYGLCLDIEGGADHTLRPALGPVLTWKARLLAVRALAPGETVGYNATFTADRPMRVALVPVGYADGLRRELGSNASAGWMMLSGESCAILGRVSMNLTVIDVSRHPAAAAGDLVTVLGPGISAGDHARLARTIPYEILCGIKAPHRRSS